MTGRFVNIWAMLRPKPLLIVFGIVLGLFASTPASAQAGCSHSGDSLKRISKKNARSAIGCLLNKGRSAPNVRRHGDLERAAQNHSAVMASKHCLSHQCPGEPNLKERVARTGYLRGASNYELGEIILYGRSRSSPRKIVDKWLNSPPHRSVITKSSFDHVGVGLAHDSGLVFVTADFGHR